MTKSNVVGCRALLHDLYGSINKYVTSAEFNSQRVKFSAIELLSDIAKLLIDLLLIIIRVHSFVQLKARSRSFHFVELILAIVTN